MKSDGISFTSMPRRNHVCLPELRYLQMLVRLSDKYPTGLEWAFSDGWRQEGSQAGKKYKNEKFYRVDIHGDRFTCHRVVYYLRTKQNPGAADIFHAADNKEKDNRKELYLVKSTDKKLPGAVDLQSLNKRYSTNDETKKKRKQYQTLDEQSYFENYSPPKEIRRDDYDESELDFIDFLNSQMVARN